MKKGKDEESSDSDEISIQRSKRKLSVSKQKQAIISDSEDDIDSQKHLKIQDCRKIGRSQWVQCDNPECQKWRRIDYAVDLDDLAYAKWVCDMNEDKKKAACEASQETVESDDEDACYTKHKPGMILWGKVPGYPWWPCMVDDDPDIDTFYWNEACTSSKELKTSIHVTFFGKECTRAWLYPYSLRKFTGEEHIKDMGTMVYRGTNFKNKVLEAIHDAKDCLKLSKKRRIEAYGFAIRFTGEEYAGNPEDSQEHDAVKEEKRKTRRNSVNDIEPEKKKKKFTKKDGPGKKRHDAQAERKETPNKSRKSATLKMVKNKEGNKKTALSKKNKSAKGASSRLKNTLALDTDSYSGGDVTSNDLSFQSDEGDISLQYSYVDASPSMAFDEKCSQTVSHVNNSKPVEKDATENKALKKASSKGCQSPSILKKTTDIWQLTRDEINSVPTLVKPTLVPINEKLVSERAEEMVEKAKSKLKADKELKSKKKDAPNPNGKLEKKDESKEIIGMMKSSKKEESEKKQELKKIKDLRMESAMKERDKKSRKPVKGQGCEKDKGRDHEDVDDSADNSNRHKSNKEMKIQPKKKGTDKENFSEETEKSVKRKDKRGCAGDKNKKEENMKKERSGKTEASDGGKNLRVESTTKQFAGEKFSLEEQTLTASSKQNIKKSGKIGSVSRKRKNSVADSEDGLQNVSGNAKKSKKQHNSLADKIFSSGTKTEREKDLKATKTKNRKSLFVEMQPDDLSKSSVKVSYSGSNEKKFTGYTGNEVSKNSKKVVRPFKKSAFFVPRKKGLDEAEGSKQQVFGSSASAKKKEARTDHKQFKRELECDHINGTENNEVKSRNGDKVNGQCITLMADYAGNFVDLEEGVTFNPNSKDSKRKTEKPSIKQTYGADHSQRSPDIISFEEANDIIGESFLGGSSDIAEILMQPSDKSKVSKSLLRKNSAVLGLSPLVPQTEEDDLEFSTLFKSTCQDPYSRNIASSQDGYVMDQVTPVMKKSGDESDDSPEF